MGRVFGVLRSLNQIKQNPDSYLKFCDFTVVGRTRKNYLETLWDEWKTRWAYDEHSVGNVDCRAIEIEFLAHKKREIHNYEP